MNYKIVYNKDVLEQFLTWLPEMKVNEGFFLILISRAKWYPESGVSSARKLVRETANSKKDIHRIIKRWEIEEGSYFDFDKKKGELPIHQNNLGVYMSYNPRSQMKACAELAKACLDAIISNKQDINVKSMANDYIQSANGSQHFMNVDVDLKGGEQFGDIIPFLNKIINSDKVAIVKAKNGFHYLIPTSEIEGNKTWYMDIKENHQFESDLNIMKTNDLIPLPGCAHGGYAPDFLHGKAFEEYCNSFKHM